jgi:RNA polymerase sigma-70 factor (ECF subfamily)
MNEIKSELLKQVLCNDKNSFKILYDHYAPFVWRLILRMTGDEYQARELLQETFIRVHASIKKFKGDSSLSTWIYRIAHNVVFSDSRRKTSHNNRHVSYDDIFAGKDCTDKYMHKEIVEKIMAQLTADEKFLLIAREIDGLPFEEIAIITGATEGSLRTKLHRLKETVRNSFDNEQVRKVAI